MIIRIADPIQDAMHMLDGAKKFIERMDYTDFLPKTEDKLIEAIGRVLTLPGMEVVIAEDEDGFLLGAVGMFYTPNLWNPDLKSGEEIFWWVDETSPKATAMRLLKFVRNRAKELGIEFLAVKGMTSSPKNIFRVYERMGLREIETAYVGLI